jgi:DNA-binding NtrC family response regulator
MNSSCNKSVLIVEDDTQMLRALEKVLTGAGCKVSSASFAKDAIDILVENSTPIDVVITDLQMPHMNGVLTGMVTIHAIHEMLPTLPIIVLTAFGTPEVKSKCISLGATSFLEKPLDSSHLIGAINNVFAPRDPSD